MTWMLMWLNKSVVTINATLQLLDIYRFGSFTLALRLIFGSIKYHISVIYQNTQN